MKKITAKLACIPTCDEIKVDGEKVDPKKLELAPGKHEVEVSKSGYESQTEKIEVKEGSAVFSKTFTLKAEASATPTPTATATATTKATAAPTGTTKTGGGKTGGGKNCKKVGFITKCN